MLPDLLAHLDAFVQEVDHLAGHPFALPQHASHLAEQGAQAVRHAHVEARLHWPSAGLVSAGFSSAVSSSSSSTSTAVDSSNSLRVTSW